MVEDGKQHIYSLLGEVSAYVQYLPAFVLLGRWHIEVCRNLNLVQLTEKVGILSGTDIQLAGMVLQVRAKRLGLQQFIYQTITLVVFPGT